MLFVWLIAFLILVVSVFLVRWLFAKQVWAQVLLIIVVILILIFLIPIIATMMQAG